MSGERSDAMDEVMELPRACDDEDRRGEGQSGDCGRKGASRVEVIFFLISL